MMDQIRGQEPLWALGGWDPRGLPFRVHLKLTVPQARRAFYGPSIRMAGGKNTDSGKIR